MGSKVIIFLLSAFIVATPCLSEAQQTQKIPRIGLLSPGTPATNAPNIEAFRKGLREVGLVEGENILIETLYAAGNLDRYPSLAAELVSLKVDIIVTASAPAVQAVKNTTKTIPIVMAAAADPVGAGLVSSLARPGGNVTGLSMRSPDLSGKRLQLLKEIVPKMRRVGILWNPTNNGSAISWRNSESMAPFMALELRSLQVQKPSDFDSAFKFLSEDRFDAFSVLRDAFLNQNVKRILEVATKSRLPAIYEAREFVLAGGLMSYAPNHLDLYRRAAFYVEKILKGAKPADLPVEQPMQAEFLINLNAAREISITIRPEMLQRADKVIR
jgi:putative ABC transport system substrate-binding protein